MRKSLADKLIAAIESAKSRGWRQVPNDYFLILLAPSSFIDLPTPTGVRQRIWTSATYNNHKSITISPYGICHVSHSTPTWMPRRDIPVSIKKAIQFMEED